MNKGLIVAICVIVIVAAVVIMMSRGGSGAGPGNTVTEQQLTLMDKSTLETETLTLAEWQSRGKDSEGYYKNAAGEYTMVESMNCPDCGAEIPKLLLPPEPIGVGGEEDYPPGMEPDSAVDPFEEWEETTARMKAEYVCPQCGKHPYGPN